MLKTEFLKRVKEKYPEKYHKYDYALLPKRVHSLDTIKIKCPTHGLFEQQVTSHIYDPFGCFGCSRDKLNEQKTKRFIGLVESKWPSQFTFENTQFVNGTTPITINCRFHGSIERLPWNILRSANTPCASCSGTKLSKDAFISLAQKTHGLKYSYSKVNYVNTSVPVTITCKEHGDFKQRPYSHYNGTGCFTCDRQVEFIRQAKIKHRGYYDYSKVVYQTHYHKVVITCKYHGDFKQIPHMHISGGGGCRLCAARDMSKVREDFIRKARLVHGDKFSYENVIYIGSKIPVKINCQVHGVFSTPPNSHVSGRSGCPRCKESKGETAVRSVLENIGVEFFQEYKIALFNFRFDFFIPDYSLFIEFNGKQHYGPIEVFGGISEFKETVRRDKAKRALVEEFGGKLLCIKWSDILIAKEVIEKEIKRIKGL